MKTFLKLVLALLLLAVGALTVLFEIFPGSAATTWVAPYCEGPYLIAKAQVVALYGQMRVRISKSSEEEESSEPASAEASEPSDAAAEADGADEPEAAAGEEASAEKPKEPPTLAKARWYTRTRVLESSCRGKVVIACVWNEETSEGLELLAQAQRIADGFTGKRDLVVFATHKGGDAAAVKKALARARVTIPVCEAAGLPCAMRIAGAPPYFYIVDKKGALKYVGRNDKAVLTKIADLF